MVSVEKALDFEVQRCSGGCVSTQVIDFHEFEMMLLGNFVSGAFLRAVLRMYQLLHCSSHLQMELFAAFSCFCQVGLRRLHVATR